MALKEDAEAGDEKYYTFVRRSNLLSGFEDEIPYMKNRFYLLECVAAGPGNTHWHHFGRTVDEAIEKCFRQTVACVLAAVNVTNDELELQLKAGHVEKLPELPKDFFTKKRVEEALRARAAAHRRAAASEYYGGAGPAGSRDAGRGWRHICKEARRGCRIKGAEGRQAVLVGPARGGGRVRVGAVADAPQAGGGSRAEEAVARAVVIWWRRRRGDCHY